MLDPNQLAAIAGAVSERVLETVGRKMDEQRPDIQLLKMKAAGENRFPWQKKGNRIQYQLCS